MNRFILGARGIFSPTDNDERKHFKPEVAARNEAIHQRVYVLHDKSDRPMWAATAPKGEA
jgi:hypothetical protein